MRLIDADALKEYVKIFSIGCGCDDDHHERFLDAIDDAPTIEPELKTGKWIPVKGSNGKDYHKCSECLHTQEITGVKNYCAVCGAKMEDTE